MTERDFRPRNSEKADSGFRSSLLMPIMEGNTLERDDVSDFLAGRLSTVDDRDANPKSVRLS
jgi:hypothetical protein